MSLLRNATRWTSYLDCQYKIGAYLNIDMSRRMRHLITLNLKRRGKMTLLKFSFSRTEECYSHSELKVYLISPYSKLQEYFSSIYRCINAHVVDESGELYFGVMF